MNIFVTIGIGLVIFWLLFVWVVDDKPAPSMEPPKPIEEPSNQPLELSCFAKGLILSLDTEPDEWIRVQDPDRCGYRHRASGVFISYTDFTAPMLYSPYSSGSLFDCYRVDVDDGVHRLSTEDRGALYKAYVNLIDRNDKIRIDKELAANQPKRTYFEQLGCK